ncbi:hypothetical protein NH340_JMT07562 [Sarcoptes scabiei]|uniref:Uncharacterized protein n=1 Tax=Sarcoptes scabiei TaxID=52283 RepID=A0A132AJX8_SARSC|nr:hypothetical protein QR98_0096960 [Sarcoptes scabiei]UXI21619.1 hypothetical protein NH340_JMT07562 [Sarcoptes scabiei]
MDDSKKKTDEIENDAGACSKMFAHMNNLVRQHGFHVVAIAALAAIGLHVYTRYVGGKTN